MRASRPPAEHAHLLSEYEQRALSDRRIKTGFVLFTTGMLLAISGLIFLLVTQIFDSLTPSLRRDLEAKALRGAISLSHEVDLGLLTSSSEEVALAVADYPSDPDVLAIVALNPRGVVVYRHGDSRWLRAGLFAGAARTLHQREHELVVWAESRFENVPVGRVALVVSTERVAAGDRLRARILAVAGVGFLIAFVAALLFVRLYVAPILRITRLTIEKLEQKTVQALAATRAKSEFLANMSHEIRTPMNGVLGMVDRLLRTSLDARQRRFAELIQSSAQGLLTIIDDVLDFSKIEAGKYDLHAQSFDVRSVVRDLVELLAPRAQEKGVSLTYQIASELPSLVSADVDRFRQILTNLLGNATKFTEHGEISLALEVRERDEESVLLHVSIRDTGPGISEEGLTKLFASFTQVDASSTRKHGGTGLGLAISRSLARLMGGDVGVESVLGQGSTFWFTVRAAVVAESTAAAAAQRALVVADEASQATLRQALASLNVQCDSCASVDEGMCAIEQALAEERPYALAFVAEELDNGGGRELAIAIAKGAIQLPVALLTATATAERTVPEGMTALAKPLQERQLRSFVTRALTAQPVLPRARAQSGAIGIRGRVLAVDDNEINQTVAVELLTELGYSVDVAVNGQDALAQIERQQYDAVLMDCQMPVMDGYEATRTLRRQEAEQGRPRLVVIALTAHALPREREKVLAAGMDDYLTKPIVSTTLERTLARHLTTERTDPKCEAAEPSAQATQVDATDTLLDREVRRSSKVLTLFLEHVPKQLTALAEAIEAADARDVAARAHKLKGGCASIGARRMAKLCEALQHAAAEGDLSGAGPLLAELDALYRATSLAAHAELAATSAQLAT